MVSKHLSRLECKLGVRLLNRSSGRLNLTEAGSAFHERSRQAIGILDAAAAAASQTTISPRGELKVAAPVWCATGRFTRVLADYRQSFPQVTIDLHLENRFVDLVAEGFDVALRATGDELSPALRGDLEA